ncbi:MAG TPA: bifunctional [glutamine synthetase] adenylyltransferase/[glutamine synthetase]-adenylyl-L-tyrosine phosphorylase [Geminicoccaceae bacterium]
MVRVAPQVTDRLPRVGDCAAAERGLVRWSRLPDALACSRSAVDLEPLLASIFGNSPYLSELLLREPAVLKRMLEVGPDAALDALLAEHAAEPPGNRARLMGNLRRAKRRVALLTALADITGLWTLERTTEVLSRFADLATQQALDLILREAAQRGELELAEQDRPQDASGLVVLGMGKLGAFELNYSSDIDLIVLFDPGRLRYRGRESPMAVAVRLTRALVHILEHRTRDGYVFRTDLRLRPHPPGHPLALSIEDAEQYYERHGQNWERAALIKARVIAGDRPAGESFLRALEPFLWRRHLDYAAIRDIHSIKRQINAYRGHGQIRVAGHDLKVGRGGIREIEFFVQTQQLILGGRLPELRTPGTCAALRALVEARWLEGAVAEELVEAYRFLRRAEHRLQMIGDKQTHSLPARSEQLERFAAFMGYPDAAALSDAVRNRLERVEAHYAALFETSIDLGGGRALVFTGTDDDPDTLATLAEMGFAQPKAIAARVRAWHHGHIRATREARARELLTELMPRLLQAIANQSDPDATFERFDEFVSNLPAGVQLFSLFRANPRLLGLVADLMGTAPRLAHHLSRHVSLFEAMLAPDFFEPLPDGAALAGELELALRRARDFQDVLDAARRWAQAREFQIGLHVLLGLVDGDAASGHLTDIAERVIQSLLPRAEDWLSAQHGRVEGGAFMVLGLGKLGSRELAIGSDLDLIFVYDAPGDARSDGPRPLPAATYYARLGQRLVSALSAPTPEGRLYEIDTRLRPSGNLGPVACSVDNFERYQLETAQTWEHQALTRARAIAGDPALARRVEAVIRRALLTRREPEALAREISAMRARIFREHGSDDPWNLKHVRGGLVELEFLAQFLKLRFAPQHPHLLTTGTVETFLRAVADRLLDPDDGAALVRAGRLYQRLQAVLRLAVQEGFHPARAPAGLRQALVRAASHGASALPAQAQDFAELEQTLIQAQARVKRAFEELCPPPEDDGCGQVGRGSPAGGG